MVTIEIKKTYTQEEISDRRTPNRYVNDPYGEIRQMIFEEMIMQTLPLKITLDNGVEIHERQTIDENEETEIQD